MQKLGAFLKQVRNQHDLSYKDVYRATGISDSKLSRIENGSKAGGPSPIDLRTLAKLYDIDLVELYILAGYQDRESLAAYQSTFHDVELLSTTERKHIQEEIYLFTQGRSKPL